MRPVTAFPENYARKAMHERGFRSYLVKPVLHGASVMPVATARAALAVVAASDIVITDFDAR